NYWNGFKNKTTMEKSDINQKLDNKNLELDFVNSEILNLQIFELKELTIIKKKVFDLNDEEKVNNDITKQFVDISQSLRQIDVVEKWLSNHNNDLKKVNEWFNAQCSENKNK